MKTFQEYLQEAWNPAEELAKRLQQRPWGEYVKDIQGGIRQSYLTELISNLIPQVPEEEAKALWNKFVPPHIPFNWGKPVSKTTDKWPHNNWTGD